MKDEFLKIREFYTNYGINILSQILNIIFSIVPVLLISNILGSEGKGTVVIFFLIIQYFQIFGGLGVSGSAIYFVSKSESNKLEVSGELFFLSIVLSVLSMVIFLPSAYFYYRANLSIDIFLLLPLGTIIIFCSITNNISQHIFIGLKKFISFSIISNSSLFFSSIIIALIIFVKADIQTIIFGYTLSHILSFFFSMYLHFRNKTKSLLKYDLNIFMPYIRYGLKSYLGRILWRVFDKLDYLILSFFVSVSAIGVYSISYMFSELIVLFATTISSLITTYVAGQNSNEYEKIISKTLRILFFIIILFAILLYIVSDYLIEYLFIDEFSSSIIPLKILLPGMTFLALGKIMASYLAGKGMPGLQSYAISISLLIAIFTNFILIPLYGINGAAISTTISFISYFLMIYYLFNKHTNISIYNIIAPR